MADFLSLDADWQAFDALISRLPREVAEKGVRRGFQKFARMYQTRLTKERLSGRRGNVGLRRVTGQLARTFQYDVTGRSLDTLRIRWVFGVPYAVVHEFGGQVTVPAHSVRTHTRTMRGREVTVRSHTRRAHTREYDARLGARDTLVKMVPELVKVCVDAVQEEIRRGTR